MGADTTLVNAAFREAESRGKAMTPDLSNDMTRAFNEIRKLGYKTVPIEIAS